MAITARLAALGGRKRALPPLRENGGRSSAEVAEAAKPRAVCESRCKLSGHEKGKEPHYTHYCKSHECLVEGHRFFRGRVASRSRACLRPVQQPRIGGRDL
jgi:hypothetical protein